MSRTNAAGAAALKTFLTYAATGKIGVSVETHRSQDSAFEEQVAAALQQKGLHGSSASGMRWLLPGPWSGRR